MEDVGMETVSYLIFYALGLIVNLGFGAAKFPVAAILNGSIPHTQVETVKWSGLNEPKGIELTTAQNMASGFYMEGNPEVQPVFGDAEFLTQNIDNFYALEGQIRQSRERFSSAVNNALRALANSKRACPLGAVSSHFLIAKQSGDEFKRLGTLFEDAYERLKIMKRLGDTQNLPPKEQKKVREAESLYLQSVKDFQEMRSVYKNQLKSELRAKRCREGAMIARASMGIPTEVAPKVKALPEHRKAFASALKKQKHPKATFSLNNQSCEEDIVVVVDGSPLGVVPGGKKMPFRISEGSHNLCLFSDGDNQRKCGEPGTVRTVLIHDGWSMTRHCEKDS